MPAFFSHGRYPIMNNYPSCFDRAVWISPSYKTASPIINKCFHIGEPAFDAKIYITGLGYFEARLNGVLFLLQATISAEIFLRSHILFVTILLTESITTLLILQTSLFQEKTHLKYGSAEDGLFKRSAMQKEIGNIPITAPAYLLSIPEMI